MDPTRRFCEAVCESLNCLIATELAGWRDRAKRRAQRKRSIPRQTVFVTREIWRNRGIQGFFGARGVLPASSVLEKYP